MAQLIKGVVDTQIENLIPIGSTNAGDDTVIELSIKSNGQDFIFNNPTFELLSKKEDNTKTRQIKDITLEDSKIKIKADIQLVLCKGMVTNQLIINDGDKISTVYFYFFVNPSLENEVLEESKDKIESLEKLDQLIGISFDNLEEYEKRLNAFGISMETMEESEEKRQANELTRSTNEKARILTEENRVANESARLENENVRTSSEEDRALAEEERITNENNRRLAENTRKSQENARVVAESERQSIFEENENIRKEQEGKRVQAESVRKNKFDTWEEREGIRLISEDQRREAEESRQLAESNRDKAEKVREQQEANRQSTYNRFNSGEEERVNNENTRKSNESSRIETENSRVAAEEERVAAENTRNSRYETAESNRNNTFNSSENSRQINYESSESTRNSAFETEERKRRNSYQDAENTRNNAFNQQEENRQREYTTAERLRVENENLRKNNEVTRGSNEETRKSNETSRVSSENIRVENENSRVAAEQKRQEDFKNIQSQYDTIVKENKTFKEELNGKLEEASESFYGKKCNNIDERIDEDVNTLQQQIYNSTLVQYEGENIKADNSYYGLVEDLEIEGKTLQNLAPTGVALCNDVTKFTHNYTSPKITQSNDGILCEIATINDSVNYCILGYDNRDTNMLQSNKYYLFLASVEIIQDSTGKGMYLSPPRYNANIDYKERRLLTGKGIIGVALQLGDDITTANNGWVAARLVSDSCIIGDGFKCHYMTIVEITREELVGLSIDELINKYNYKFEGIKSVGTLVNDKYEIGVNSCGKNLMSDGIELGLWNFYEKIKNPNTNYARSKKLEKCKPNTNYVFSGSAISSYGGNLAFYDKNKKYLGNDKQLFSFKNFTTPPNAYFILFHIPINSVTNIDGTVQLEEGTIATQYGPYQESTVTYQLSDEFRGIPNGAKDTINKDGLLTNRVGKVVLDGSENYTLGVDSFVNNYRYYTRLSKPLKIQKLGLGYCDKFSVLTSFIDTTGVMLGYSNDCLYLHLPKSQFPSVDSVKQWLHDNPVTVYYELATPVTEQLTPKPILKTFEGVTHINSTNGFKPILKCKVSSNVQALLQDTRARNLALENELVDTTYKLQETDSQLKEMDTDLVKTNWEMDDRLFEVEWALEDAGLVTPVSTFNINNKMRGSASVMALSKFEQAKIIIMSGDYDRVTLEGQLSKYLKRNIIAQDEYDTLISMMDAKEIVVGE